MFRAVDRTNRANDPISLYKNSVLRVLVFGSLNVDKVHRVEHIVKLGETITAKSCELFPGGKGLNQALACARAGLGVFMAGAVGKRDAQFLLDLLSESKVSIESVLHLEGESGSALIQLDDQGNNSIIVVPAANRKLTKAQIDTVLERFLSDDVLVVQNEVNLVPYMVKAAHKRNMRIAYNPSPMDADALRVDFSLLDFLFVNEGEARTLLSTALAQKFSQSHSLSTKKLLSSVGYQDDSLELSPQALMDALCECYPELTIILTLGADGALAGRGVAEQKGSVRVFEPAHKTTVLDTCAAGDTFTGYFLAEYFRSQIEKDSHIALRQDAGSYISDSQDKMRQQNEDSFQEKLRLQKALQSASAAAALAVSKKGAASSIPYATEVF